MMDQEAKKALEELRIAVSDIRKKVDAMIEEMGLEDEEEEDESDDEDEDDYEEDEEEEEEQIQPRRRKSIE